MTVLTGFVILLAVLVVVGVAVLATIASAAEIVPPWLGRADETLNTSLSSARPQPVRTEYRRESV